MSVENSRYVPISPQTIRPNTKGQFDVYLMRGGNYVLFNGQGGSFSEERCQELADNKVGALYIDAQAVRQYQAYIRDNIANMLVDESLSVEERAQVWVGTVSELGRDAFEKNLPGPTFAKRFKRFEGLVQKTSTFVSSPRSLKFLARFISKGNDAYQHGISTMVYAVSLMAELGMDEHKTLATGMGAMFHDIGKAGLPEKLKEKDPAEYTEDDKEVLRLHPMIGVRTCATFNLPQTASNCILFHHEREDGTGYPTQASAEDVPAYTKVVRLCNRYDNLTRHSDTRKVFTPFNALKQIMEDDGFIDRAMLKTFIQMLSKAEIV